MPQPLISEALSRLMPPMATAGTETEEQISFSFSAVILIAFFFVGDGNTAPTPR